MMLWLAVFMAACVLLMLGAAMVVEMLWRARRTGRSCFCLWRFAVVYDCEFDAAWPGYGLELGASVDGEACAPGQAGENEPCEA